MDMEHLPQQELQPDKDHEELGLSPEELERRRREKLLKKRGLWASFFEDPEAGIRFNQDPQKRDPQTQDEDLTPLQKWLKNRHIEDQLSRQAEHINPDQPLEVGYITDDSFDQFRAELHQLLIDHIDQKITEASLAIGESGVFSNDTLEADYDHADLAFLLELSHKLKTASSPAYSSLDPVAREHGPYSEEVELAYSEIIDQLHLAAAGQSPELSTPPAYEPPSPTIPANHDPEIINLLGGAAPLPTNPINQAPENTPLYNYNQNTYQAAPAQSLPVRKQPGINNSESRQAPSPPTAQVTLSPDQPTSTRAQGAPKVALGGAFAAGYAMGKIKKVASKTEPTPSSNIDPKPIIATPQVNVEVEQAARIFDANVALKESQLQYAQQEVQTAPPVASNSVPIINNQPFTSQIPQPEQPAQSVQQHQHSPVTSELKNHSLEVAKMSDTELLQMAGKTKFEGRSVSSLFKSGNITRSGLEKIVGTMFFGGSVLAAVKNALKPDSAVETAPAVQQDISSQASPSDNQSPTQGQQGTQPTINPHYSAQTTLSAAPQEQNNANIPIAPKEEAVKVSNKSQKKNSILIGLALVFVMAALILLAIILLTT